MLETLEQTNIGNLNLEEPKVPRFQFNTEKEITLEDWEAMRADILKIRPDDLIETRLHSQFINEKLHRLLTLRRLSPERFIESDVEESIYLSGIRFAAALEQNVTYFNATEALSFLAPLVSLFPNKKKEVISEAEKFKGILLEGLTSSNTGWEYLNCVAVLPEILPIIRSSEEIKEILTADIKRSRGLFKEHDRHFFGGILASVKLLLPDNNLTVSEEEWSVMKEVLSNCKTIDRDRRGNWSIFANVAWAMKILAAENVSIASDGSIEFPEFKPLLLQVPNLPEVRKF